jgi:TonB family protein
MIAARRAAGAAGIVLGGALGVLAAPVEVAAQQTVQVVPGCLSRAPVTDSVESVLHLALAVWHPVHERARAPRPSESEREALTLVLQQIRDAVTLPRALPVFLNDSTPFDVDDDTTRRPLLMRPALHGALALTLHTNGRISNFGFERRSISDALDATLITMLERQDSLGGFWYAAGPLPQDSVRLLLTTTHRPGRQEVSTPLARIRLPRYPGTQVRARRGPAPRYPDIAEKAGISSAVMVEFVVDTTGRADTSTVRLVLAELEEFVTEVRRVLPRLRFEPARIAGCPVQQLVLQPFVFNMPKRQPVQREPDFLPWPR